MHKIKNQPHNQSAPISPIYTDRNKEGKLHQQQTPTHEALSGRSQPSSGGNRALSVKNIIRNSLLALTFIATARQVGKSGDLINPESKDLINTGSGDVSQIGELVCNGEPGSVAIAYLGQIHKGPSMDEKIKNLVIESQKENLDILIKTGAKHVFTEKREEDFSLAIAKKKNPEKTLQYIKWIQNIFSDYRPDAPLTKEQAEVLLYAEAADIYVYLDNHNDVTLHATTTKKAQHAFSQYFSNHQERMTSKDWVPNEKDIKVLMTNREKLAIKKIKNFSDSNPGENAVLIYGLNHNFQQYCDSDGFSPRMFEYNIASYLDNGNQKPTEQHAVD